MSTIKEYIDSASLALFENMSIRDYLRAVTVMPNGSTNITWHEDPRIKKEEEEKELSTEELFNNVKKELKNIL